MISKELIDAVAALCRAMPRNPLVISVEEALSKCCVVTPVVTSAPVVTKLVTPKRDRAKYMRNYRASQSNAGNNGRPETKPQAL